MRIGIECNFSFAHVDSRNVCAQSAMNGVNAVARVATCVLGNRESVIV